MCRMYAAVSKNVIQRGWIDPVQDLAVNGKTRSDMPEPGHHDGWGMVAYFKENFPEYLERQPHSVTKDAEHFKNGAAAVQEGKSKAVMIHFRKISVGQPQISNTHPFLCKEWSFCHNGTIFDSEKIPLKTLKPAGATDSERFFLYLMERLDPKNPPKSLQVALDEIKKIVKYTSLTFLLSNGETICAYRDCDPQYDDYYTLFSSKMNGTHIVASEPLTQVSPFWKPLLNGALLALNC